MSATPRQLCLATLAVYVLTMTYTGLRWEAIPEMVPTHAGLNGEVDAVSPKSFLSVMAIPLIGLVVSIGTALIAPSPALARAAATPEATLPSSESAARRVELLSTTTQQMVAELVLVVAVVLSLAHLTLLWSTVSFGVFIIALVALMVWTIWRTIRLFQDARAGTRQIQPDAEETLRLETLKRKAGGGVYSEPADPMAAAVLPDEPSNLQINTAHPAGKRQVTRMAVGLVAMIVVPIAMSLAI